MKKLATLLLAAGMVVSASAPANAVDVKVDGFYKFAFQTGQTGFDGANDENVLHRMRLGLTMAASENLSGYFQFQVGTEAWGTTDDTNGHKKGETIRTRQVYIDWKVPGTDVQVRMGRQGLGLPADAFGGNAVLCANWGVRDGIVVASPVTDWLGLSAVWTRIGLSGTNATNSGDLDQNLSDDVYALVADMKFDGVSGAVWAAYATVDGATAGPANQANNFVSYGQPNAEGKAWWVGFTSTFTYFDPFTLKLSAAYGSYEADKDSKYDQDGWNVQAKASYKTAFGTPVLGAWYFSGDDKDEKGIIPSAGGYFTPTLTYHDASNGLQGGVNAFMPAGNWGVQAGIEDVSFLQGLSHNFHVTYMEGTNDKDSARIGTTGSDTYLSEEDSLVSFDLLTKYEIYKNLNVYLETSYIISDFDSNAVNGDGVRLSEDDWRAELVFVYDF